jgi:hypothetical protein
VPTTQSCLKFHSTRSYVSEKRGTVYQNLSFNILFTQLFIIAPKCQRAYTPRTHARTHDVSAFDVHFPPFVRPSLQVPVRVRSNITAPAVDVRPAHGLTPRQCTLPRDERIVRLLLFCCASGAAHRVSEWSREAEAGGRAHMRGKRSNAGAERRNVERVPGRRNARSGSSQPAGSWRTNQRRQRSQGR